MITFPKVPLVNVGDPVTSTQRSKLVAAVNARIRSGLGNPVERIFFWWLGVYRQIRNPNDGGNLWPTNAEFQELYLMLDPSMALWPGIIPPIEGDDASTEGSPNLSNIFNSFIFGNRAVNLAVTNGVVPSTAGVQPQPLGAGALGLDPENIRTDTVKLVNWPANRPPTATEMFRLGQIQRGAYDPATGALASPTFYAARTYSAIRADRYSPHGNSYGGFMPIPEIIGQCGDGTETQPLPNDYRIFFTGLRPGISTSNLHGTVTVVGGKPVVTYPGTCPPGSLNYAAGNVIWQSKTSFAYYIYIGAADGSVAATDILPAADWLEGPYDGGGVLTKTFGEHLARAFDSFAKDFRGSIPQRHDLQTYNLEHAFDFQRFLTTQYFLAPVKGHQDGASVVPDVPTWQWGVNQAPGTLGAPHQYATGFVLTFAHITATALDKSATIEALDGNTVLATIPVTTGADKIVFFDGAKTPNLNFRLKDGIVFSGGAGMLTIETLEQLEYKPGIEDAYLLLRLAGATPNETVSGTDGSGLDEDLAKEIGDNYFANGIVTNRHGTAGVIGQTETVNDNAVFDSMRRLAQHCRAITRQQFIGYEVTGGKSVLYFKRYAFGLDNQTPVDTFAGIAPSRFPIPPGVAALRPGVKYVARQGPVTYNKVIYQPGAGFTAVWGAADFSPGANGLLFEQEGIYHTAGETGETNEWVVLPVTKVAGLDTGDASNQFKPAAFTDWANPIWNRCHFNNPMLSSNAFGDMLLHFSFGVKPAYFPEALSGFNYARGSQFMRGFSDDYKVNFYRSCRLYEPPVEVESCTVQVEAGVDVVRVQLSGRLHHCSVAPQSIARDSSTWNISDLRAEPYRSHENALREYLVGGSDFSNPCTRGKPGDSASSAPIFQDFDGVFGACFPEFIFLQLVPDVFQDNNDDQDSHDTVVTMDFTAQLEVYARAMCEGYVDGLTRPTFACRHDFASSFCYTFENACLAAFGRRWFTTLNDTYRPDVPQGFGPLPNTEFLAQQYNEFAAFFNVLDKVPIYLPMSLQCKTDSFQGYADIAPDWPPGATCSAGTTKCSWVGAPPSASGAELPGEWADCVAVTALTSGGIFNSCTGGGGFQAQSLRSVTTYRYALTDPLSVEAIPEGWADMVADGGNTGFVGVQITQRSVPSRTPAADLAHADGCCFAFQEPCPGFFWDAPSVTGWNFHDKQTQDVVCGTFSSQGVLDAGTTPPAGAFYFGRTVDAAECSNGSSVAVQITPVLGETGLVKVPVV